MHDWQGSHKSSPWAFGSGELKRKQNLSVSFGNASDSDQSAEALWHIQRNPEYKSFLQNARINAL